MDDLISRQAAIDAVNRLSLGETDAVRLSMRIADYLNRMPPAQPERKKMITALLEKGKTMTDYIKREDAIKAFDPSQRQDWYTPWIVETLEDLPSADVAPVRHGRWIEHYKSDAPPTLKERWICSWCGNVQTYGTTDYCPNCGARMDGDENEID